MNPRSLIKSALRVCGVIGQGIEPTADETFDTMEALNMMLGAWFSSGIAVPYTVTEDFDTVEGTASYNIGDGATFDTDRPEKILTAFIRDDDNVDYPLEIISQREYWETISQKTTESIPKFLFYDALNTTGKIYLYPTPDDAYELHLISEKNITELTSDTIDDDTDLLIPRVFEEAIKYNLAIRIAPEFGAQLSQIVYGMAKGSYDLMQRHCLLKRKPMSIVTDPGRASRPKGNIYTDGL